MIFDDVMRCLAEDRRSPILLTERREHLDIFVERFEGFVKNIIVFRGGMGIRQRRDLMESLRAVPEGEERLLLYEVEKF